MSEKKHTKAEVLNEEAEGLSRTRTYTYEPKKYRYHGRRVTLKELAAECDVSARTLRRRLANGLSLEAAVTAPAGSTDRYKDKRSLCWSCANSTNGSKCPWARSFVPVAGWEAEKTQIKGNGKGAKGYESYNVKKCPLYRADRVSAGGVNGEAKA